MRCRLRLHPWQAGACRGSEQQGPPPGSAHHLLPQPHRRAAERASLWRQHSNDQLQQEAQHWRHQAAAGQHGGRQLQPGHLPGHRGAAPDAGLCLHGEHCARRQPGKCAQLMCVASSSVHNAALRQHGRATAAQAGLTGALLWLIAAAPYECYYHIGAGGSHNCRGDLSSPKFALLQAADRPASWQDQVSFLGRTVHYCTPSLKGGPPKESLAQRFNALSGECCTFSLHPTGKV